MLPCYQASMTFNVTAWEIIWNHYSSPWIWETVLEPADFANLSDNKWRVVKTLEWVTKILMIAKHDVFFFKRLWHNINCITNTQIRFIEPWLPINNFKIWRYPPPSCRHPRHIQPLHDARDTAPSGYDFLKHHNSWHCKAPKDPLTKGNLPQKGLEKRQLLLGGWTFPTHLVIKTTFTGWYIWGWNFLHSLRVGPARKMGD